jgi:hypothetical protein
VYSQTALDSLFGPADDVRHPMVGTFMDIVVWLRGLGLGKYEAAFRENEIDETVFPSLTEEHLKQLGVTALGRRVKLLDAIAALRRDAGVKAPSLDTTTTSSAQGARPEDRAERRQVTVVHRLLGLKELAF